MIDVGKIEQAIRAASEVALQRTVEYTESRAKHHAPVRAIFKRSRRGKRFTLKGPISTEHAYQKFLSSKERRRRVDVGRLTSDVKRKTVVTTAAGRTEERDITIPGSPTARAATLGQRGARSARGNPMLSRGSISGHANSLLPVFSQNGFRILGDFRRFGPVEEIIRQRRGTAARVVRAESLEEHPRLARGRNIESARTSQLSSRGRYEVKHAKSRGLLGGRLRDEGRVGGRLRDEIHIIAPHWRGNTLWASVESPTEYAQWQEFGTSHHRAQPFLRPALYESRKVLLQEANRVGRYVGGPR